MTAAQLSIEHVDYHAANYVLREAEGSGDGWIAPSGFYELLIRAMFHADAHHLRLLAQVYPAAASAVYVYNNEDNGRTWLVEKAKIPA